MTNEKYNGWTNWATWNANLWLTSNDEQTFEVVSELVNKYRGDELPKLLEAVLYDTTRDIREKLGDQGDFEFYKINWNEMIESIKEGNNE